LEKKDRLSESVEELLLGEVERLIRRLKITDAQFFYNLTKYFDDDYDSFTWNLSDY